MPEIRPPPYLAGIRDYLKAAEPDIWKWFSSATFRAEYADNVRLDLLKGAYRLDRASHGPLHAQAEDVLRLLGLAIPATLYQEQLNNRLNAALVYLPGEGHLLFSGALLETLTPPETGWVVAHEFSHHALFAGADGEFHAADQILNAMAGHRRAQPSHLQSFRLFRLYSEIFADRGALSAFGDPLLGVSTLVKIETGLKDVSPAGYLAQADEIFSKEKVSTRELTHPEAFIRARAIKLWADRGEDAEPEIARMIEGTPALDDLDLLAQQRMTRLTKQVISRFLARPALRSETFAAHARLFFDDFAPGDAWPVEPADLTSVDPSVQSYFCHLLLDFTAVDPQLEDVPLAAAILESRALGLEDRFLTIAARELKLKKKALEKVKADAEQILAKAGGTP
ncbi:MAG TPA: hypothetical protein VFC90_05995 [Planctomycetota bacterium]|nr:hypothetical protein [Planctomycetota bacterium]